MKLSEWNGEKQSSEDLNRKFHGTYVFASALKGEPQTYAISEVGHGVVFASTEKTQINFNLADFDILEALPAAGVYSLEGGGVALLRMTGTRQFREGLCLETMHITINGDKPLTALGFQTAKQLFGPQRDVALVEGRQTLSEKIKCVRLNRDFWLKKDADATYLYFRRARVGSWTATGRFFWNSVAKSLQEEVKDRLGFYA